MNTLMTWETFKKRQVNTKQWLLTDLLIYDPLWGVVMVIDWMKFSTPKVWNNQIFKLGNWIWKLFQNGQPQPQLQKS